MPEYSAKQPPSFDQFRNEQVIRVLENLVRADTLSRRTDESEEVASDIRRAAVVFLHATLEEFLRSLASFFLSYCDEEALNKIPLVGMGNSDKFSLGKLAAYREKTVLEVIQESVDDSLLRTTYNNTNDIAALLASLRFDITPIRPLFPKLDDLMKRRHQIVHTADKLHGEIVSITFEQVSEWVGLVQKFMEEVLGNPPRKDGGGSKAKRRVASRSRGKSP